MRAEDGRRVEACDISPFISNLPMSAPGTCCAMSLDYQHAEGLVSASLAGGLSECSVAVLAERWAATLEYCNACAALQIMSI